MPTLADLPLAIGPWEAVFVALPARVDGVELEGALVVAEASGALRAVVPVAVGVPLGPVFRQACADATPPTSPARPCLVWCDAALAARLPGLPVAVGPTPAADAALRELRAATRPVSAPGLDADLGRWAIVSRRLVATAPWAALSDAVTFTFVGRPELDEAVGIVTGGPRPGVVVFPSAAAYRAYRDDAPFDARCVHLERTVDPDEAAACEAADLAPSGYFPRAYAVQGGEILPLGPAAQRALLAAVEGITALCGAEPGRLRWARGSEEVRTVAGDVVARSSPDGVAHALVDVEHAIGFGAMTPRRGDPVPVFVVKLDTIDAQRVARRVFRADGVGLGRLGGAFQLRVFQGGAPGVALVGLPAETAAALGALPVDAALLLCVSGGGTDAVDFDAAAFVAQRQVRYRGADDRRHEAVFDGPAEAWPALATRLLRVARAGFGDSVGDLPDEALRDALAIAQGVWNAVASADFLDAPTDLDALLAAEAAAEDRARITAMVAHRRTAYPGDPRWVREVRVVGPKERGLVAEGSLPAGYVLAEPR